MADGAAACPSRLGGGGRGCWVRTERLDLVKLIISMLHVVSVCVCVCVCPSSLETRPTPSSVRILAMNFTCFFYVDTTPLRNPAELSSRSRDRDDNADVPSSSPRQARPLPGNSPPCPRLTAQHHPKVWGAAARQLSSVSSEGSAASDDTKSSYRPKQVSNPRAGAPHGRASIS